MKFINQINAKMMFLSALLVLTGFGLGLMVGVSKKSADDESDVAYAVLRPLQDPKSKGDTIYGRDVLSGIAQELEQLDRAKYDLKKRAVETLVRARVATTAASTAADETLKAESGAKVPAEAPITAAELQAFLKERGIDRSSLNEKQIANVQANMRFQRKKNEERKAQDAELAKFDVVWKIPLPAGKTMKLGVAKAAPLNPNGKIELQLVSNFQCPTCHVAESRVEALRAKYGERLKVAYRFTMVEPDGSIVRRTAEAALCANDQKKFWEFHDAVIKDPAGSATAHTAIAGLDISKFEKCVTDRNHKSTLEKEVEESVQAGAAEAPMVVIGGRALHGASPLEHMIQAIDAQL